VFFLTSVRGHSRVVGFSTLHTPAPFSIPAIEAVSWRVKSTSGDEGSLTRTTAKCPATFHLPSSSGEHHTTLRALEFLVCLWRWAVKSGVLPGSHQLQILDPVIALVLVLVMYDFPGPQVSTEMVCHHVPVFEYPAATVGHRVVSE
jgi:hypothetical protein